MAALTFAAEVVLLRQQLLQVLIILKTELRPTSQQGSLPTFQTNLAASICIILRRPGHGSTQLHHTSRWQRPEIERTKNANQMAWHLRCGQNYSF